MTIPANSFFKSYNQLNKDIDALSLSLEKTHAKHINCKKGCDLCCMAISVFPVEFHAIKTELEKSEMTILPKPKDPSRCRFLVDHSCTIYEHRPVICRTHGLPLVYMSMDTDEYELSLCELNFTEFDFEEFDEENTFPLDKINSRLYQINKQFVAGFEGGRYTEQDRISLSDLMDE